MPFPSTECNPELRPLVVMAESYLQQGFTVHEIGAAFAQAAVNHLSRNVLPRVIYVDSAGFASFEL